MAVNHPWEGAIDDIQLNKVKVLPVKILFNSILINYHATVKSDYVIYHFDNKYFITHKYPS